MIIMVSPYEVGNRRVDHEGRFPFMPSVISGVLTLDGAWQDCLIMWNDTAEMLEEIEKLK